ncbi:unnamed protein product [Auanema sp. JU1783]|nr:unnamed protein product [Auanema sp. JU1783]
MGGNFVVAISRKRKHEDDGEHQLARRCSRLEGSSSRSCMSGSSEFESSEVVVDGRITIKDYVSRGFTKPKFKINLLPYHKELDKWADEQLTHLLSGINSSILIDEPVPALYNYMLYMAEYIDHFGLRFTYTQHIKLVKLFYLIFTKENQWHEVIHLSAQVLEKLIRGSRLCRKDLELDWKPVYNVYYEAKYGKAEEVEPEKIGTATWKLNRFYPLTATKEIWEKLQVHISPRYSNKIFSNLCLIFLPTNLTAEEHHKFGAALWWETTWGFYSVVEMGHFWGDEFPMLFSYLHYNSPDFMDFTLLYDDTFTRILRSMGLSMRKGKIVIGDGGGMQNIDTYAHWVSNWLGGPKSCQPQLARLMKCLEPFLHPSNAGDHTNIILLFMQCMCDRLVKRVYEERIKKHKRECPEKYYLSDDDISQFVDVLLPPTLTALYNGDDLKMCTKVVMMLASLDPGAVIPKFLEHTYPALNAVCEPHRLIQTLDCLIELAFQLAVDTLPERKKASIDGNWMAELEKIRDMSAIRYHRSASLSFREKQVKSQHFLTLRHHLINLMEALVVAIDINDVEKTTVGLENLIMIFYLVPIIDASPCIVIWKDLTEDEKQLCELTGRLPLIASQVMNKILQIVGSLAVCAPKDTMEFVGGLKDEATKTGEEEKALRKVIDRCVSVLLANSSADIAEELIEKVYHFMSTNQFESSIATEIAAGIVAQVVFVRPQFWRKFAELVHRKLKVVLTPEVRKQRDVDSVVLWYINLGSSIFCTTSEIFVKNKDLCNEIITLLLECESKVAHETAVNCLWYSLFMLSRTYPLQQHVIGKSLNRPLTEWVPIREWAEVFQEHEVEMLWHVPSEQYKQVVTELLQKFMFPYMELLQDHNLDTFAMRKYLNQVSICLCGAIPCLPMPDSGKGESVNPGPSVVPCPKRGPTGFTNKQFEISYTDGRNVREVLLEILEDIVDRLANSKDDHQALNTITAFLRALIDEKSIDSGELNSVTSRTTDVFSNLSDPCMYGKRLTLSSMESYVHTIHLNFVCREQNYPYSHYQKRIMHLLLKLAVNDYPDVRVSAKTELNNMLNDYPQAKEQLIEDIVAILENPDSPEERLKGALNVVRDNRWACTGNIKSRCILWKALISMKMSERPFFVETMDAIWGQIGTLTTPTRKPAVVGELTEYVQQWWDELPKIGVWKALDSKEKIEDAIALKKERKKQRKETQEKLVKTLLEIFEKSGTLHHTRAKLCRTMLWRCQRQNAKVDTIRILLNKMVDDEEYLRSRCADELSFWLKKNKPKTIRMEWECPKRPENCHMLLCGLRKDNLCVAYDSENLPDTEEKWNKTVFFTRQHGCYKWPKSVSVVTYASNKVLDREELTPEEETIVGWFEKTANVEKWVQLMLVQKKDDIALADSTWWMVKYLLRNFPGSEKIFENFLGALKSLMKSKERAKQRLAAELFLGIAKGTKYFSFKKLDEMWKWLAPAVDHLYDIMNNEAEYAWLNSLARLFTKEDPRRYWWLIEQLIVGMSRPSPTPWHQAMRSEVIIANKWRDIEIRKRMCEISWEQLPVATTEVQRNAVSTTLKHICTLYDTNLCNDFDGIPERFQLRGTDFWLERFEKMINCLDESHLTSSTSMIDATTFEKEHESPLGLRSHSQQDLSFDEDRERRSLIYLRTLIEFLLQYYEDCMTSLTPGIVAKFPMLVNHANEDESEDQSTFRDFDIKQNASLLVHDYMGSLLLSEKYADDFLNTVINSFYSSCQWRVKVSVLKYIQVLVFSNVFVCEKNKRRELVTDFLFKALTDVQNEVRHEAYQCLLSLAHCEYIKLDSVVVQRLHELNSHTERRFQHGAVLGYAALVMAFPYSTPKGIIPIIQELCRVTSKNAEIQSTATSALREFRRSHRDEWEKTSRILGPQLVYQIENAIAPLYYV